MSKISVQNRIFGRSQRARRSGICDFRRVLQHFLNFGIRRKMPAAELRFSYEKYSYFCTADSKMHVFTTKNAFRGGRCRQLRKTSGLAEITHVVLENTIFVEDFRVPENRGGGGPVEASRVSPNRSFGVRVL